MGTNSSKQQRIDKSYKISLTECIFIFLIHPFLTRVPNNIFRYLSRKKWQNLVKLDELLIFELSIIRARFPSPWEFELQRVFCIYNGKSLVIRKKENLKTGVSRKQSTWNFPKNEKRLFFTPWYAHVRVRIRG